MTNEERIKEAVKILARGGRLVVAKNVKLPEVGPAGLGGIPVAAALGIKVQVCDWLEDDTVIAIAPEMDSERLALKFAQSLPETAAPSDQGKGRAP